MMYWGIKFASQKEAFGFHEFNDDQLIFYRGAFGVPNYLTWHATTWPQRPKDAEFKNEFTFFMYDGVEGEETPCFQMDMVIKNFLFDVRSQDYKIIAIDKLYEVLRKTNVMNYLDISTRDNPVGGKEMIERIVFSITKGNIDIVYDKNIIETVKYFELSVDPEITALDLISKICAENGWEWYHGYDSQGEHIFLGMPFIVKNMSPIPFLPDTENYKHIYNDLYRNITMSSYNVEPFQEVGTLGRVLWVKYYLNNVSPLMTMFLQQKTGNGYNLLSEFEFIDTLEGREAELGRERLASDFRSYSIIAGKTFGKYTDNHRDKYEISKFSGDMKTVSRDLNKTEFDTKREKNNQIYYTEDKKITTPYAGNGVGLLFPQEDSHNVLFSPKGNRDSALVGPSFFGFGDDIPKRDDEKDFRLQLPNGWALYVDKDGNTILQVNDVSPSEIPTGDSNQTYIKLNTDGTIEVNTNDQEIHFNSASNNVALDDHKHSIGTHTHQVAPGPLIPGPPVTTVSASTPYTEADPDSVSKYFKVEK